MTASPPSGSQELAALRFLAEHGPLSAGQMAETFGAEHGLARSTVLTMMERLRKKGNLTRKRVDGVFVYASALDRAGVLNRAVGQFVERALQGSVSPIAAYLTEQGEVSEDELRDLRRAVRALKSKRKEGSQ